MPKIHCACVSYFLRRQTSSSGNIISQFFSSHAEPIDPLIKKIGHVSCNLKEGQIVLHPNVEEKNSAPYMHDQRTSGEDSWELNECSIRLTPETQAFLQVFQLNFLALITRWRYLITKILNSIELSNRMFFFCTTKSAWRVSFWLAHLISVSWFYFILFPVFRTFHFPWNLYCQ